MQHLHRLPLVGVSVLLLALVGCTVPPHRAPVEERSVGKPPAATPTTPVTVQTPEPLKPLPGAENAGKPGYYTVKPGDTLIRIALDNGQSWKDLARWNGMDNPNIIEVGQVLRVVPPGVDPSSVTTRPLASTRVESRPLDGKATASNTPASGASAPATSAIPSSGPSGVVASAPTPPVIKDDDDISWGWPASGQVLAGFDEVRNKGMAFAGKAGDPVFAAADGRVMYAGAGLRGYGNMIIIKHSTNYLTAYAHNQTLLVKEDQVVRKGQKIAEMGDTDTDRVKLHFEVRKQGKPIDPAKLLPTR
ncbi:peptidoglycan DD-metalloendopeptidase family protein [Roseateles sp. SL47]|jgi:lipoprotein NlpD|uniref:peptidoglycan DD-metalloendopeptidase family protein n=1 Tax=Roseateles sp. SL47 TaxID=2995138 RepID=UPI00226DC3CE|nr:peptidoglycan DD-metalloendopeptidase family protein [Roseateles sp. SL47]WAC72048.1 peptidoglycan DD-metalloendopeptidase family protein [Roseateles sp. SL47]